SRTGSIIVTVYGDAIVPRGGEAGLAMLLALFRAMGVGDGVVRTACSRLARDGWLTRRRWGRLSFYRLGPRGLAEFGAADARIYGSLDRPWDGKLRLAFPQAGEDRAALDAAGFAPAASGVLASPNPAPTGVLTLLGEGDATTMRAFAARVWSVERLGDSYGRFLERFAPLQRGAETLAPLRALVARVLLIHEYRRVVLRDPALPVALLPEDWPGWEARHLCAGLYRVLLPASEAWLSSGEAGPLSPPDPALLARFSGGDTLPSATAS
ncbi:MAG: phenylacetic acid degradation operon negative regulatory protein PaaX, partial [Acetobacteraceae bacterium]|nr:phenylacetic acid degradation operon negative regulatory protein PaaX [Acetobacteraceae bacterium]